MYKKCIKRILDIIFSLILLLILSPILFFAVLVLAITNSGNPFFFQNRPGKKAKIFRIVKLRTMKHEIRSDGKKLTDEERLSTVGRFIRKFSIDEVPQLWNVIKGDMSLVGPRPLLPEFLSLYTVFQERRHLVRPGITGWAQVNGRNSISWNQKFIYDVWYVENLSFMVDMKILLETFKQFLLNKDRNFRDSGTTKPFNGVN